MQQALGAAAHSPLLASTMGSDPSGEIRSPAMARRHGNPYGEVMSDFYVCKSLIRTLGPRAGESRQTLVSLLVSD